MFNQDEDPHSQFYWQIRRQRFLRFVARLVLGILFICSLSFLLFHTSGCAVHRDSKFTPQQQGLDSVTFRGCRVIDNQTTAETICRCDKIVWAVDAKDKHHKIALCAK